MFNEIRKFGGEDGGGGGGGGWYVVERPCCFGRIGWGGVLIKEGKGMSSKEFMSINDMLLSLGWKGGSMRVVPVEVCASKGTCMGEIDRDGGWANFVVEESNEVEGMAKASSHLGLLCAVGGIDFADWVISLNFERGLMGGSVKGVVDVRLSWLGGKTEDVSDCLLHES